MIGRPGSFQIPWDGDESNPFDLQTTVVATRGPLSRARPRIGSHDNSTEGWTLLDAGITDEDDDYNIY